MKKVLLATAVVAMSATSAFAQSSVDLTLGDATITFEGERAVECEVDGLEQAVSFGALGRRGQASAFVDTGVDFFCNQPSDVTFTSTNGYLKLNAGNPANLGTEANFESGANAGFWAGLDYTATIVGIGGGITGDSTLLTAGTTSPSLPIPAQNRNNVRLRYDTITAGMPLLGGTYNDTLTISVTPAGV